VLLRTNAMEQLLADRIQFSNAIFCPGCGHSGYARWEESAVPHQSGRQRKLALLSNGFRHEPQQQQQSRDPAIICEKCGTQLAD
jgi:DNA-directed RNA polymerase subunit RPC12/RpoP